MFKRSKQIVYSVIAVFVMLMSGLPSNQVLIHADDVDEDYDLTKFSVKIVQPENQIDPKVSYFFLRMNPNQVQTIAIEVVNTSNESIIIEAEHSIALSNQNGVVVYSKETDGRVDSSLKFDIRNLVTLKETELKLNAGETKQFTADISMPSGTFEGILLGGFKFSIKEAKQSGGVGHTYAYEIALALTQEDINATPISKSLDLINVRTENAIDSRKVTLLEFQNNEPRMLRPLDIQVIVRNEAGEEVLSRSTKNYSITPNSIIDYELDWKLKNVKAGHYTAQVNAQSGDESWQWNYKFEISDNTAKKTNESSAFVVRLPRELQIAMILIGVVTVVNIGYLFLRKLKKDSGNQSKKVEA